MKFSCEHCHRRFSTREDPVPGRVYRIGCRCGHVIVLRPGEAAAPPPLPAPRRVIVSPGGPSPRRAAPPPLPRTATRAPVARDEPPRADPAPAPCGPRATAGARRPALPELATTPTPPPMSHDDMHCIPRLPACRTPSWAETLVRAARASLGAGLAAWRSERTISRTLRASMLGRPEPTGRRTLLAGVAAGGSQHASLRTFLGACTASACVTALLAGWVVATTSRPRAETTVTTERETATTAVPAPTGAAEESGARVASSGTPRQRPAAAAALSPPRLAERVPAASVAPALEADREAAAPVRAQALDAAPTSEAAALAAPTEASELAAGAPSRPAATPDSAASDGTPPEEAAAWATTAAAAPEEAQPAHDDEAFAAPIQAATAAAAPEEAQPAQDDEALATPMQAATAAAAPEGSQPAERDEASPTVEPVPAKGTLPAAGSSDDRSASAGTL